MHQHIITVKNRDLMDMAKRAFDLVDPRLIGHGERVSRIMFRLLKKEGGFSPLEIRNLLLLAVLHDIGAYKMEEIDRMVEFETQNVWNHSIYGYLFFSHFTFMTDLAPVIFLHHSPWRAVKEIQEVSERVKLSAQLLHLADRIDIYMESFGYKDSKQELMDKLSESGGITFSPEVLAIARDLDFFQGREEQEEVESEYLKVLEMVPFTGEEKESILKMLTYAIDFRSPHTVTHTITTTVISQVLAERLCSDPKDVREVYFGAMLHDLGKIGIPVEILEYPGKLSPQAMGVMRTHVSLTEQILGDSVAEAVRDIALRHHEKLDGSGYPRGLTASRLNTPQRIVAVADIVSALTGTRSYKEAFPKEKTTSIITGMAQQGFLDASIVSLMTEDFDIIMEAVRKQVDPLLESYQKVQSQYMELSGLTTGKLWNP